MMRSNKTIRMSLTLSALTGLALLTGSAHAATISYVGVQYDLEAKTDDPGVGWRNATTAKTHDIDGNNVLGTDGYAFFGSSAIADALPTYVSGVSELGGTTGGGRLLIDNPLDASGADVEAYSLYDLPGFNIEADLVSFTLDLSGASLGSAATLRVNFLADHYNNAWGSGWEYTYRLAGSGGGNAASPTLVRGAPNDLDAISFDITGFEDGEVYTLYGTPLSGGRADIQVSGVTFDSVIPEPSSLVLLGLGGLGVLRRCRK